MKLVDTFFHQSGRGCFARKNSHYPRSTSVFFILVAISLGSMLPVTGQSVPVPVILEDFQGYSSNIFSKWLARDASVKSAASIYKLVSEAGNTYLGADTYGSSVQIAKRVTWNLRSHPFISWKWRVRRLPFKGNESIGRTNDSAASIYVIFQRARLPFLSWDRQPINIIKYVWSTTLPAGQVINKKRDKVGVVFYEGRFVVLQTGISRKGRWVTEKRNVFEDYRRFYGASPPGNPVLIAILTDSNETKSSAFADYDDIVILPR